MGSWLAGAALKATKVGLNPGLTVKTVPLTRAPRDGSRRAASLALFLILLSGATQAQPGFGDESILSSPSAQGSNLAVPSQLGLAGLICIPKSVRPQEE